MEQRASMSKAVRRGKACSSCVLCPHLHTQEGAPQLSQDQAGDLRGYTEFELAAKLKYYGWSLPAYKMPPDQ